MGKSKTPADRDTLRRERIFRLKRSLELEFDRIDAGESIRTFAGTVFGMLKGIYEIEAGEKDDEHAKELATLFEGRKAVAERYSELCARIRKVEGPEDLSLLVKELDEDPHWRESWE